jgi:hypothetical protein
MKDMDEKHLNLLNNEFEEILTEIVRLDYNLTNIENSLPNSFSLMLNSELQPIIDTLSSHIKETLSIKNEIPKSEVRLLNNLENLKYMLNPLFNIENLFVAQKEQIDLAKNSI